MEGSAATLTQIVGQMQLFNSCLTKGLESLLATGWRLPSVPFWIDLSNMTVCLLKASQRESLLAKEGTILVPSTFPRNEERLDIAYDFYNFSEGDQSKEGSWAKGKALDGEGEYQWLSTPKVEGKAPKLDPVTPKMYGTPPEK